MPSSVPAVTIQAIGAGAGCGDRGAVVSGGFQVYAGETLTMLVGGSGGGGAGGGGTFVWTGASASASADSLLLAAGGAGGCASGGNDALTGTGGGAGNAGGAQQVATGGAGGVNGQGGGGVSSVGTGGGAGGAGLLSNGGNGDPQYGAAIGGTAIDAATNAGAGGSGAATGGYGGGGGAGIVSGGGGGGYSGGGGGYGAAGDGSGGGGGSYISSAADGPSAFISQVAGVGTGSGSVVFSVVEASVSCKAPNGSTILSSDNVACTFLPGSGAAFTSWTASGFGPSTSTSSSERFGAGAAGSGTITAKWTDTLGAAQSQSFSYTIIADPNCTPGILTHDSIPPPSAYTTLNPGDQVSCSFPSDFSAADDQVGFFNGFTNEALWAATDWFTPLSSQNLSQTFTLRQGTDRDIAIGASWLDGSGTSEFSSFVYTLAVPSCTLGSTTATTTIEATDTVDCSFTLGSGDSFAAGQGWTETGGFSPGSSTGATPTFTAPSSAGSGSLSVAWTGDTGSSHSQSFAYTVLAPSCSVAAGTTLLVGDQVSCSFTAGSGDTGFGWTASGFTPTPSSTVSQTFTASAAGSASITANWTDANGVSRSVTFDYTAAAPTCKPADTGVQVLPGTIVDCVFTKTAQDQFSNWTASTGVLPGTSPTQTQAFTLDQPGTATITAQWVQGGTNQRSLNFQYTVTASPPAPTITCTPGTGSLLAVGQTVTCSFTAGNPPETLRGWVATDFSPPSSRSATPTFTALRAGNATITVYWTDSRGQGHSQTFHYTAKVGGCLC